PTGIGKTLMGLFFASEIEKKVKGPIIYTLPYLSIIEQTTDVFNSIRWDTLRISVVQHHSLSFPQMERKNENPNFEQARFSLESWEGDIIVTTFDQLFYSFLSRCRGFVRRFFQLPSSVLICDEVQTLPARLIPAVETFLKKMCKKLNLQILYMTATHPPFLKDAKLILQDDKKYFESLNRTELKLCIKRPISFQKYLESLPEWLKQRRGKSILFVANTIRSSLQLFNFLNALKKQEADFHSLQLFYLSGNVVPIQRIQEIRKIKKCLDSKSHPWMVIVSTQCIEAGVDIDVDEIVRDFAPWDCLLQICGRANRFGFKDRSLVWVYRWLDDLHDKEFNRYIYDPVFIQATLDVIKRRKSVKEEEYWKVQKEYVQELEQRLSEKDPSQELVNNALSWQFNKLNFQDLFRGIDTWKISLFCVADDLARWLQKIAISLWMDKNPEKALEYLGKLSRKTKLLTPLTQFLRTTPKEIRRLTKEFRAKGKRNLFYQLPCLLNPMLQAYTISIPVRKLEKLREIDWISEGFPYVPNKYYDSLQGFSPRQKTYNNII
ncbi:MAG: CRISPR-associated helicase Cas3', partial [Candidatus Thermoplasmatota archaeon]